MWSQQIDKYSILRKRVSPFITMSLTRVIQIRDNLAIEFTYIHGVSSALFLFLASVALMRSICVAISDNQIALVCI